MHATPNRKFLKKHDNTPKFISSSLSNTPNILSSTIAPQNQQNSHHQTPIKSKTVPYNPFDVQLEHLKSHICSPNVFAAMTPAKGPPVFKWSIEDISIIKPTEINDPHHSDPLYHHIEEEDTQQFINHYFNNNIIEPSPWSSKTNEPHLFTRCTQTTISIPPSIDLIQLLGQEYCIGDEELSNMMCSVDSVGNSSLRRKLFPHHNEDSSELTDSESNKENEEVVENPPEKRVIENVFSLSPVKTPSRKCSLLQSAPFNFELSPIASGSNSDNDYQEDTNASLINAFLGTKVEDELSSKKLLDTSPLKDLTDLI